LLSAFNRCQNLVAIVPTHGEADQLLWHVLSLPHKTRFCFLYTLPYPLCCGKKWQSLAPH
jgi:hypothetical protein